MRFSECVQGQAEKKKTADERGTEQGKDCERLGCWTDRSSNESGGKGNEREQSISAIAAIDGLNGTAKEEGRSVLKKKKKKNSTEQSGGRVRFPQT